MLSSWRAESILQAIYYSAMSMVLLLPLLYLKKGLEHRGIRIPVAVSSIAGEDVVGSLESLTTTGFSTSGCITR